MLGGTSGSKFVVNFSIEGTGEKDLQNIAKLFKNIEKSSSGSGSSHGQGIAGGLGEATKHAGALEGGLAGAAGAMGAFGVAAMVGVGAIEKVAETGVGLIDVGVKILEGWGKVFEVLLHKGSEFESLILRIQGSGKTKSEAVSMMKEALEITKELPLTEMDAARITQTFSTIHVDAMKRMGESYEELNAKGQTMKGLDEILGIEKMKKEGPKAITVVGDMLSAMGHLGTGYQTQAIHEMMVTLETGKIMSKLTFAGLGGDLEVFKKKLQGAKDPAARLIAMQDILSKRGALGLSQASMTTWGGVMSNFKGIIDQFAFAILQPGEAGGLLSKLTKGMIALYDTIKEFFDMTKPEGAAFLGMLRESVGMVGGMMVFAMKKLGLVVKEIFGFMAAHPLFMKMVVGMTLLVSGLSILSGVAILATVAFVGFLAAFALLPVIVAVVQLGIGLVVAALGTLGAMLTAGIVIFKAWEANFGGIKSFFEDIGIVIDAVRESFEDWNKGITSITVETADKLKKRGLLGIFLDVINMIRQTEAFYDSFMDSFLHKWKSIAPKFEAAWAVLSGAMQRITDSVRAVLGVFLDMTGGGKKAVDEAANSGEEWGNSLARVADNIAGLAQTAAGWVDSLIGSIPQLIMSFAHWYEILLDIKSVFDFLVGGIRIVFDTLALGMASVMAQLIPTLDLMWGLVQAKDAFLRGDLQGAALAMSNATEKARQDHEKYENKAEDAARGVAAGFVQQQGGVQGLYSGNHEKAEDLKEKALALARQTVHDRGKTGDDDTDKGNDRWTSMIPEKDNNTWQPGNMTRPGPRAPDVVIHTNLVLDGALLSSVVSKHVTEEQERAGNNKGKEH